MSIGIVPEFVAPGAGQWALDSSHYPGGTTPISIWLMENASRRGMAKMMTELGVPAETLEVKFVNGFMYSRLRPLINADKTATKLPPLPMLKAVTRLHPKFRRARSMARKTLAERPWRRVIVEWHTTLRPQLVRENSALGSFDLSAATNDEMASHLDALLTHLDCSFELHFYLHGFDLGPIGRYFLKCQQWGISLADAVESVKGTSPSTAAPAKEAAEIRALLAQFETTPKTFEELRAMSPEIGERVDKYFEHRRASMVLRYDLDSPTLGELPNLMLASIVTAADGVTTHAMLALANEVAARLRDLVPGADVALFDETLAEARLALDLRDDNGPVTAEWPLGILRLAMLQAGTNLLASGRVMSAAHIFELHPHELAPMVRDGSGVSADELASRATSRAEMALIDAPKLLGPDPVEPPLAALPPELAELVQMVQLVLSQLGLDGQPTGVGLSGVGVGDTAYRGIARQVRTADDAADLIQPGDIIVVPFTSPTFNMILPLCGAIVTSNGGAMSHAAVMARELGIPAVVGAPGALTDIPDGALIEVDPVSGCVTIIATDRRPD